MESSATPVSGPPVTRYYPLLDRAIARILAVRALPSGLPQAHRTILCAAHMRLALGGLSCRRAEHYALLYLMAGTDRAPAGAGRFSDRRICEMVRAELGGAGHEGV